MKAQVVWQLQKYAEDHAGVQTRMLPRDLTGDCHLCLHVKSDGDQLDSMHLSGVQPFHKVLS